MLTGGETGPCPFCPGNEAMTPPEVDAVRAPGSAPDGPGWTVRAFPNKYPAALGHEVVAEGERHLEQPGDLDESTWEQAIAVWQRRVAALEADGGHAFLFKNVGKAAGASIAHNHSQILRLDAPPPRIALEAQRAEEAGFCPWCREIAAARAEERTILETGGHVVLSPEPPKLPHETWVLPVRCDDDFLSTDRASLARALAPLFAAVRDSLRSPASNLWLHRMRDRRFHWHFELQPRTGQLAGLELGADMYINSLPAAESAALLRAPMMRREDGG
ncbi:MAG: galactose-1-phosphate uridylyltransferase [Planctomycetota bacterium]